MTIILRTFPHKILHTLGFGLMVGISCVMANEKSDPIPSSQSFHDWRLVCLNAGSCVLEQQVILTEQSGKGKRLLRALFSTAETLSNRSSHKPPDKRLVMTLITPLGVYLPSGIGLRIDQAQEQSFPMQRCDGNGCQAFVVVDATMRKNLERGSKAIVNLSLDQDHRIGIPLSLMGITAGLNAIE